MIGVTALLVFVTSLVVALSVIPIILRLAQAYGIYDIPDVALASSNDTMPVSQGQTHSQIGRRIHTAPIPRLGGGGIVLAVLLSILVWLSPRAISSILLPSLALYVMGLYDDLHTIRPRWKFAIQLTFCGLAVYFSGMGLSSLVLSPAVVVPIPPTLGVLFSTFIIVGAINATNMIDGLYGLAGGMVLIGIDFLS